MSSQSLSADPGPAEGSNPDAVAKPFVWLASWLKDEMYRPGKPAGESETDRHDLSEITA
jgi:hypothetical protein